MGSIDGAACQIARLRKAPDWSGLRGRVIRQMEWESKVCCRAHIRGRLCADELLSGVVWWSTRDEWVAPGLEHKSKEPAAP